MTGGAFHVTFFRTRAAAEKTEEVLTMTALAERIAETTAPAKSDLPWLKLARFGDIRTEKNSLRHDANVRAITGIEADYDGEAMPVEAAIEKLTKAGLAGIIYTSPSHRPEKPRWRVMCPTSQELPPDRRKHFLGRLNGLFGGVFANESWTLSQSYYLGSVNGNPAHRVEVVDGRAIDELEELDAIWFGPPDTKPSGTRAQVGAVDESALLTAIAEGRNYHEACTRLAGKWALAGVPLVEVQQRLFKAMDAVPVCGQDARWWERRQDVDRCLVDIFGKQARKLDTEALQLWGQPDMTVLSIRRRPAPPLPIRCFGTEWAKWIESAARAAACPQDYVALPLLAAASALIGNARWAQATAGWIEPPHLWCCVVGDSGSSKSPGADCLLRDVVPELERRMLGDFPELHRDWKAKDEAYQAAVERWQKDVREAEKRKTPPPLPPEDAPEEPQAPRLRQTDVTIEKLGTLLASAAPKGLLLTRDELAGWLLGMTQYNDSGRAFWIEAYGGRSYRIERVKHPKPITIPRLAVAVTGGTQPDKLAELFHDPDDGLLSRICWAWPEPLPFRLGRDIPNVEIAIAALDRLRLLDLGVDRNDEPPAPLLVPLDTQAQAMIEAFGQEIQNRQIDAAGLMNSAYGKARGLTLRLSLVLAMLRWCITQTSEPPLKIGLEELGAACDLVADYFMPMAARVFGDAATPKVDRDAATLARWIRSTKPKEVHVRELQRNIRLPGLRTAEAIHAAANALIEAGWLRSPGQGRFQARAKAAYAVNPAVLATSDE